MNCETMKNRILLEQSDELSWWARRRLVAHLARCSACRTYQQQLINLTEAVRRVPWEKGFATPLARRVLAATSARERNTALSWQPALAYGVLSVLLALSFTLMMRPFHWVETVADTPSVKATELAWDANLDDRIATLDHLLNEADLDWSDGERSGSENGDIDSIAQQLLALEGEQI